MSIKKPLARLPASLAVHAAIATLLAVFVGGAYYFTTGDLLGLVVFGALEIDVAVAGFWLLQRYF